MACAAAQWAQAGYAWCEVEDFARGVSRALGADVFGILRTLTPRRCSVACQVWALLFWRGDGLELARG
eukprot:4465867-Lingulodinium_polyedra.AAC.1